MYGISFNGSEACGSVSRQNLNQKRYETPPIQEPAQDTVCFRGKDDEKSSSLGKGILATLVTAGVVIGGLAYAHKANWVSKMSDGKIKDWLSKGTETCFNWCKKGKELGIKYWNKFINFFKSKKD